MPPTYVEDAFVVEGIKDGNMLIKWPDGERRSVPLRIMRIVHARVGAALAMHDHRQAEVVPIDGKGGG